MLHDIMSNRFLTVILLTFGLSGCMQELADSNYASTESGYETAVTRTLNTQLAKKIAAGTPVGGVPAVLPISKTYALNGQSQGEASPVPVINNNSYGSLSSGVIQAGVFMPNQYPIYQVPTFGANVYSPAQGR